MVDLAASVWRDFVTDGVPASGANKPLKSKIREWGSWLESRQTGSGLLYNFSSTTADADPGAGTFRLNNAAPSSATLLYVDNLDATGVDVSGILTSWDDSTSSVRGALTFRGVTNPSVVLVYSVTGTVIDGTGYRKVTLTYINGSGTPTSGDEFVLTFARSGDQGGLLTNLTNLASGDVNVDMANAINNASAGGGPFYTHITATDHNVDRHTDGLWGGVLRIAHNVGGLLMRGYRIAFQVKLTHDQKAQHAENQFVAGTLQAIGTAAGAFNGSGLTAATAKGGLFAGNSYVGAQSGYTYLYNGTATEFNTQFLSGSSVYYKSGIQVVGFDEVQGSEVDCAISLSGVGGVGGVGIGGGAFKGYKHGILFGSQNAGLPNDPVTGILIGDYYNPTAAIPLQAADLINMSNYTFSGAVLKTKGYTITGSGGVEAGNPSVAGPVVYDFHTSGNLIDYDSRILASGGTASIGAGRLDFVSAQIGFGSGLVIDWASGDVTLTHSSNSLAFAGASNGYSFDAAVKPSANDAAALGSAAVAWSDAFLASGAVLNFNNGNYTVTHSAGTLTFSAGASWGAAILPTTDDGAALGSTAKEWSDLFLASGAVINFANGNYTATHSSGKLTVSGGLISTGAGGIGYTTGAIGGVTQATSKSTGVTVNAPSGQIVMNGAALAAGAIVSFVVTNSSIAAGDVLILNHISAGTPGAYSLNGRCTGAGTATIDVRNNTAGSLSEAIAIQYALIKCS